MKSDRFKIKDEMMKRKEKQYYWRFDSKLDKSVLFIDALDESWWDYKDKRGLKAAKKLAEKIIRLSEKQLKRIEKARETFVKKFKEEPDYWEHCFNSKIRRSQLDLFIRLNKDKIKDVTIEIKSKKILKDYKKEKTRGLT